MILVDTSVWVDHLRYGDEELHSLLEQDLVLTHPAVIQELALGNLPRRESTIGYLEALGKAVVGTHEEVMLLLSNRRIWGQGLSAVDLGLLVSTAITSGALLWTRDQRLRRAASDMQLAYES